ncbi:MAG: protein kinase [Planctomycetes bacterium]|nr:protein kinase [Planctomycetota bacterium]
MLQSGTNLGPFSIEQELGRGGMGVVFLARDTRLDRPVALKALPDHLVADADRLARFEREAKLLAALNHPNIAAIYGIEQHDAHRLLVLELVEGDTLAHRLKDGPVPIPEALHLAIQIAEALEVAHEKGIVHRDLKPGNAMVTPESRIKVLDFGLARTDVAATSSFTVQADSPTVTTPRLVHSPTIPGVIMGTAGYMSPEQARGKPVDKRSDIFSFGCILYEMLTGAGPFPGETATDSIGAVLHKEPDWSLLPTQTPPRLRDLLARCLAKDRKQRLHDIGDARIELAACLAAREWEHAPRTVKRTSLLLTAALTAAALALGAGLTYALRPTITTTPAAPASLEIPSRSDKYMFASQPAISPDGRTIVFRARNIATGTASLWVRPIDSFDARPLAETEEGQQPFWSHDSKSIGFVAAGKIWAVDASRGGEKRMIAAESNISGACWHKDGSITIGRITLDSGILRIPAPGATPQELTRIEPGSTERQHCWPLLLPDGQHFLYNAVDFNPDSEIRVGRLYASRIGSNERTLVGNIISRVWYLEPGFLIYIDDSVIKKVPFDAKALKLTGEPVTIGDGVFYFKEFGYSSLSVANDGTLAYAPPRAGESLVWIDNSGHRIGTIGPKANIADPRISPDGERIAAGVSDRRTGTSDIWIFETSRPASQRLTSDARDESAPAWSHDGSTIYFSSDIVDTPRIYSISSTGSGTITPVFGANTGGNVWYATDASPDGKFLLVAGHFAKLGSDIRAVDLSKPGSEGTLFASSPADEGGAVFSPRGDWVAYMANASGRFEIFIEPFPSTGQRVQVSLNGGYHPLWSPAGDRLYFLTMPASLSEPGTPVMAVDFTTPESFRRPPAPKVAFESPVNISGWDIAPDGKRFIIEPDPRDTPPIRILLNATQHLAPERSR